MNTTVIHARVAAELAVHRGDIVEAQLTLELALASAPAELRPELEEALEWIGDIMPARPSWVGEA